MIAACSNPHAQRRQQEVQRRLFHPSHLTPDERVLRSIGRTARFCGLHSNSYVRARALVCACEYECVCGCVSDKRYLGPNKSQGVTTLESVRTHASTRRRSFSFSRVRHATSRHTQTMKNSNNVNKLQHLTTGQNLSRKPTNKQQWASVSGPCVRARPFLVWCRTRIPFPAPGGSKRCSRLLLPWAWNSAHMRHELG